MKKSIKGLTLEFMPYSEIRNLNSGERIRKLLSIVLGNKIIVLQGRLEPEEETRLMYVCLTRAKQLLYVTYCRNRKQFGNSGKIYYKKCFPSQFLFKSGLLKNR